MTSSRKLDSAAASRKRFWTHFYVAVSMELVQTRSRDSVVVIIKLGIFFFKKNKKLQNLKLNFEIKN